MDESVQDSTDVDIYAGLPSFKYDETLDKLKKSEARLLYDNGKLKILVEEKTHLIEQLESKICNLELNISSLLKTARLEIDRKLRTIEELRTQITTYRRKPVPASPRTKLSNHRERLRLDRTPRKTGEKVNLVRRDLSKSTFEQPTDIPAPSVPIAETGRSEENEQENGPRKSSPAIAATIFQPSAPIHTLYSARALHRIRAENGQNVGPLPGSDPIPAVPSKDLASSGNDAPVNPSAKDPKPSGDPIQLNPIKSSTEKPKGPAKVVKVSEKTAPSPSAKPGRSRVASSSCSLIDTAPVTSPPPPTIVVDATSHVKHRANNSSSAESQANNNKRLPAPPGLLVAVNQSDAHKINEVASCDTSKNKRTDLHGNTARVETPAETIQTPKPTDNSHFTRLRHTTRSQMTFSPISRVWGQKSSLPEEPVVFLPPRTETNAIPKKNTLVRAETLPRPDMMRLNNSKTTVVELFGSPLKWTENSSEVVTFDITSPAVFEDSVLTQTDCADKMNSTDHSANALLKPASDSKSTPTATQTDARKTHFLCNEHTLAEPSVTHFESTTQFVAGLAKTYTQLSPLKSPRSCNSTPQLEKVTSSSIPLRNFSNESLLPESTTQFIASLAKPRTQISPIKSPVTSKSPLRLEANAIPKQPVSAQLSEVVSESTQSPKTPSVFNLQSQTSVNIFSKNRTSKRDFSDKPINVLQPRKTPRIVGTSQSSSRPHPIKPSIQSTTSGESPSAKIAISESFLSKQVKRVRHWQKEKLFCDSFSVSDNGVNRASEVHHHTEVVYSPAISTPTGEKLIESPVTNSAEVLGKAKPMHCVASVITPNHVQETVDILEKPKQTTCGPSVITRKSTRSSVEITGKSRPTNRDSVITSAPVQDCADASVKSKQSPTSVVPIKPVVRTSNFKRSSALKSTATGDSGDLRTRLQVIADTLYKPRRVKHAEKYRHFKRSPRQTENGNRKLSSAGHNRGHEPAVKKTMASPPKIESRALSPLTTLPSTKLFVRPRKNVQLQSTTPSSTVHITYGNESNPTSKSPVSSIRSNCQSTSALKVNLKLTNCVGHSSTPQLKVQTPSLNVPSKPMDVTPCPQPSQSNGQGPSGEATTLTPVMKKRKVNLSCMTQFTPHKVFVYGKDS